MKFKRLLKALFSRRQKDAVGHYVKSIPIIDTLIAKDMLYIDYKKPYVAISLRLHLAHIDDEEKLTSRKYQLLRKWGLIERDRRYKALLSNILAYINYRRGLIGLPFHNPKQRLDFLVMNLEDTKPLLVGMYQGGEVDYRNFTTDYTD